MLSFESLVSNLIAIHITLQTAPTNTKFTGNVSNIHSKVLEMETGVLLSLEKILLIVHFVTYILRKVIILKMIGDARIARYVS
jgi:hypothetical protein